MEREGMKVKEELGNSKLHRSGFRGIPGGFQAVNEGDSGGFQGIPRDSTLIRDLGRVTTLGNS